MSRYKRNQSLPSDASRFEPPKETPTVEGHPGTDFPATNETAEQTLKRIERERARVNMSETPPYSFGGEPVKWEPKDPKDIGVQPPTLGRIVIFVPDETDLITKQNEAGRLPAIITRVNDNGTVNLKVFCDWMFNQWKPEVPFSLDENEPFSWHWPPRV